MNHNEINTRKIIEYLSESNTQMGFINHLKIRYRPLICPFEDLLMQIQPGETIFDIGCGSGQFLLLANKFCKPAKVIGIEINDNLIHNANTLFQQKKFTNFTFHTFDGKNIPDTIREADKIFLIDVLHHINPDSVGPFISSIALKMKKGAVLIFKDIDAQNPLVIFNKFHDLIFSKEIGNEISFKHALDLIEDKGLQIVSANKKRMYVYPHYTIVAKKN